jgi:hypothetical protein
MRFCVSNANSGFKIREFLLHCRCRLLLTSGRHAVGEFELAPVGECQRHSRFVDRTHWLLLLLAHEFTERPKRPGGHWNRRCKFDSQQTLTFRKYKITTQALGFCFRTLVTPLFGKETNVSPVSNCALPAK